MNCLVVLTVIEHARELDRAPDLVSALNPSRLLPMALILVLISGFGIPVAVACSAFFAHAMVQVSAIVETDPAPQVEVTAHDAAIWINPI